MSSEYEVIDLGAEDCLFLSIFSPECAHNLPAFVWIHGGGFQNGNGKLDFSDMVQQSNNSLVTAVLQYRLNYFGFLSSPDVKQHGQLNAGLMNHKQALQWVQDYIYLFGGDRKHVKLGGEFAGAASIYFHIRDMTFLSLLSLTCIRLLQNTVSSRTLCGQARFFRRQP